MVVVIYPDSLPTNSAHKVKYAILRLITSTAPHQLKATYIQTRCQPLIGANLPSLALFAGFVKISATLCSDCTYSN